MQDNNGNVLFRQGDVIKLQLSSEPHPRKIGKIIESRKVLQVNRDSSIHLFIKNNSYGFNEALLRSATIFDKVEILEKSNGENNRYIVPLNIIFEKGSYLNFKQQGFEIQIFLKLDIIKQYKQ